MPRLAALLVAAMSCCAFAADYPYSYERVKVADGIYAFVEPFGRAIVSSNVIAIVGEDAVAVIDTGHHPRLSRAIAGEIRALTPKPVRYVVNTHWHNDHVSGNSVFAEAFPAATFVAHSFTARVMDKDVRAFQGPNCAPFLRTQSQPLRDGIASGKGADGAPIAQARLARMKRFVAEADAGIEECGEFRYRGVDLTFEDHVTLRLGKRDVELQHLGRANTAGDVIAWIPDAKVLATGDIVVHPFPFATQSYIAEWVAVLRKLDAMPFEALVPGHGPVMRDRKYLRQVAGVMDSVMTQARAAYKPGMTADELKKVIDVKTARAEFSGDDPMIAANFDYNIGDLAVTRAWQELAGKWEPEGFKDPS